MSILKYFQTSLPTPEQTGIGERATTSANIEVSKQLKLTDGKKKAYTTFSDEDRAKIGKHAAENGNSTALKNLSNRINKNTYIILYNETFTKHCDAKICDPTVMLINYIVPKMA